MGQMPPVPSNSRLSPSPVKVFIYQCIWLILLVPSWEAHSQSDNNQRHLSRSSDFLPLVSVCHKSLSAKATSHLSVSDFFQFRCNFLFYFSSPTKEKQKWWSPPHKSSSELSLMGRWTPSKKRTVGAATSRPILVLTSVCTPALGQYVTDQLLSNQIPSTTLAGLDESEERQWCLILGFPDTWKPTKELWPQSSQYIESTQHRVKGGHRTSLAVLWLRLCASRITGGTGSITSGY